MQKITVADISTKTGSGDKGPWTNTQITDEAGAKYSSFDTKLSKLNKGAVIEAEIEVKGKYLNIKEWKLISEGTTTGNGSSGSQMSKEDWDKKDAITRASIESQKRADLIVQLRKAGVIKDDHPLFQQALKWLGGGATQEPTKQEPAKAQAENTPIKNAGDLLTRCAKIKITKARLLELAGVTDISEITDLQMAWAQAQADAQFNQL